MRGPPGQGLLIKIAIPRRLEGFDDIERDDRMEDSRLAH